MLTASLSAPTWVVPSALAAISATLVAVAAWFRRPRSQASGERDIRLLFGETPDLMCVTRLDGRIRKSNPAWERVLGYKEAQLGDVRLEDLALEEDRSAVVSAVEKLHTSPASSQIVVRMLDASGGTRWVLWSVSTPREEPVIVWSGKDITALKEARINLEHFASSLYSENQTLSNSVEEARNAAMLKSRLLAQTSHEIRTPMNGVVGMTELLLTTGLDTEQREYAETIRESAESMMTILNGLLEFSRLEAKQAQFENIPFDPAAVTAGVRLLFSARAHQSKLSLTSTYAPDLPKTAHGDPHRLRQVLINLVSNAIKFTGEGSVHIGVDVASKTPTGCVLRFTVKDTGIGIPQDKLSAIFQPFAQADASIKRKFGGTGLGLAIARQLVESLGGQMGVESEPGAGSKFWFTLPLQIKEQEPPLAKPVPLPMRAVAGKRTVLVVEDNPINQKLARQILEKEGYSVQVESNGHAAVEAVMRRRFDLVLMDIQMPEMDGITATEEIRRREKGHRTTIVALTAGAVSADRETCIRAGMDDFMAKPLTRDALKQIAARWSPVEPVVELARR